ncbi:sodium-dependent transporter [Lachnospiraceae bacterium NSJ-143]|nr:sodium-dependent transporter [Lachnospiraceae bacterium NSJ-143]
MEREKLGSRLGFLLLSAGCAIGIGNVWRFPYITGLYGGGAFVLLYLFFLVIMGMPIMSMEFAVGRASKKSIAKSYLYLEKLGQKWHYHSLFAMAGNYILMMFYTTVAGWMLHYFYLMIKGGFAGKTTEEVSAVFGTMLSQPLVMGFWMVLVVIVGFGICSAGLEKGVERITKIMMISLMAIMIVLAVHSIIIPGSTEGLKFYLLPDFGRMKEVGIWPTVVAAMNQAFFTLSLGIGAMAIFGSYIGKEHALLGESLRIGVLDTFVAIVAGLIIFPACSAYGINPGQGPSLIFITLPNVFNSMAGGRVWGALFFLFMAFAAFSTVIAVFENIISFGIDMFGWSRKKAAYINIVAVILLSLPCVFGYNIWSAFQPLGDGSAVLDLEDFIVSNLLLPLGSLIYLLFCVSRYGWGWDNYIKEVNTGSGIKVPKWSRFYLTYILPLLILLVFLQGIFKF